MKELLNKIDTSKISLFQQSFESNTSEENNEIENNDLEFISKKPRIDFENKGTTYSFSFQFE